MSGPDGFIFWGLFLVFGAIVAGYVVWMVRVERRRASPARPEPPGSDRGTIERRNDP